MGIQQHVYTPVSITDDIGLILLCVCVWQLTCSDGGQAHVVITLLHGLVGIILHQVKT